MGGRLHLGFVVFGFGCFVYFDNSVVCFMLFDFYSVAWMWILCQLAFSSCFGCCCGLVG